MKFFDTIDKVEKGFLAVLLLFATGLLFTNVVLRYCFQSAIFWTEEMLRYIMVWITLIGMSICVSEDSHISIDVLSNLIKPKHRKILKIVLNILGLIFGLFFLYVSTKFVIQIKSTGQVSATIWDTPMYIIYSCFPIGFLLYAVRSVEMIIKFVKGGDVE